MLGYKNLKSNDCSDNEIKLAFTSFRRSAIHVFAFSGLASLLMLTPSIYMLQIYDRVLLSRSEDTLWFLTILIVFVYIFIGVIDWFRGAIAQRAWVEIYRSLASKVFFSSFEINKISRDRNDCFWIDELQKIRLAMTGKSMFALFDAPWSLLYLAVTFLFHQALGWFALAGTILLFLLAFIEENGTRKHSKVSENSISDPHQDAICYINNSDFISGMGMLENVHKHWIYKHDLFLWKNITSNEFALKMKAVNKSVRMILQSMALGICAWLVLRHEMTAGMMIAGTLLLNRTLSPIDQIIRASRNWLNAKESMRRISKLLDYINSKKEKIKITDSKGCIQVENLMVALSPKGRPVLNGINFKLNSGDLLVIVGPSGSGKSTLIRCVVNSCIPLRGKITINGIPLLLCQTGDFGKILGYLPQNVCLVPGTIADNISNFDEIDENRIIDVAESVGIHESIVQLSDGYQTRIEKREQWLSNGQRQRIGLARVLYENPRIVVMDEPNAHMDNEGEDLLLKTIIRLKKSGITQIIVTNDPETIKLANRVLVIKNGMQVDYGAPEEVLMRKKKNINYINFN